MIHINPLKNILYKEPQADYNIKSGYRHAGSYIIIIVSFFIKYSCTYIMNLIMETIQVDISNESKIIIFDLVK